MAYLSKSMSKSHQALSTYEKECMSIILAVDKWRQYLQHAEFVIRTDHRCLLYLTEQRVSSKIQQKALLKPMGLQFKTQYKKGIHNIVADALSRCPGSTHLLAVSFCNPTWLQQDKLGYEDDEEAVKIL